MKLIIGLVFILMITLTVFPQNREKASLSGTVRDVAGAVIPGVTIRADSAEGKDIFGRTDDNGKYDILLPKGNYSLSYSGVRGFADRTMFGFVRTANFKDRYDIDTVLVTNLEGTIVTEMTGVPAGKKPTENPVSCFISRSDRLTLVGIVVDTNQARIPRTTISATEKSGRVYSAVADSEGNYKLELTRGEYTVAFRGASFGAVEFDLKVDQFGVRSIDALLEVQPNINVIEIPVKGN